MTNFKRWILTLFLGFGMGAGTAALDPTAKLGDVLRHGLAGVLAPIAALKMTLAKDDADAVPPAAMSKGAGQP